MGEMDAKPKTARKIALSIRILLLAALVLLLAVAVRWRMLATEYQRAIDLFDQGKYEAAQTRLQQVMDRPLAAFRIREKARRAIGLCKAEQAGEIVRQERSLEGYAKALDLLEQARREAGATPEIERRIEEYKGYLERQKAAAPTAP